MQIKNKNILITGGANGIGFLLLKKLIEKGANVIVLDNDKNKLKQINKNNQHTNTDITPNINNATINTTPLMKSNHNNNDIRAKPNENHNNHIHNHHNNNECGP